MGKVLLIFSSKENSRLLTEWVSQSHEVIAAQDASDLQTDFDLAIIDGIALNQYSAIIQARKQAVDPLFLPVLLITQKPDVSLASHHLWKTIDDLVLTPIERTELSASIEILMRARQQSIQLGTVNAQLRQEIQQREVSEHQLATNLIWTQELYRVSQRLNMAFTPQELLNVLSTIEFLQPITYASILSFSRVWDETPPEAYEILAMLPASSAPDDTLYPFHADEFPFNLLDANFLNSKPLLIGDVDSDLRCRDLPAEPKQNSETKCLMLFPLVIRGEWFGLLQLHTQKANQWTEETFAHLGSLVEQFAVEINNFLLYEAEVKARERAEEADLLKSRFLAIVSHELRTPLVPIKQFADLILREITANRKVMEYTGIIHQEADNLYELVGQLLDFARLENAQFRIDKSEIHLDEILQFAMAQMTAVTTSHQFVLDISPDLPTLVVDLKRIAQVLVNLVTNAVKYSPPDTTIVLTARASDSVVQIDVADQGAGIPQDSRLMVFEPFARLKGTTLKPGLGLGLAICKGIIEAHQGRIWIQDGDGAVGTIISLTLPTGDKDAKPV